MPLEAGLFRANARRVHPTYLLFAGICAAYLVGMVLNWRAVVSLAPVALLIAAALQPGSWQRLRVIRHNEPALLLFGSYALVLISGLWSEDLPEWRHLLFRYLPFLGLPIAFSLAWPLQLRERYWLGICYVGITGLVALGTVAQFLLDYEAQADRINRSQNITAISGVFHIHFGLMMALAIFFAVALAKVAPRFGHRSHAFLLRLIAGFLVIALHLLAYRSGMLVFYTILVVVAGRQLRYRNSMMGIALLLAMVLAPVVAYFTLEPIQRRVGNTLYDLNRFRTGQDINHYSLAQRLAAWTNAGTLIRQHWALGVSPADVPLEMQRQYERRSFNLRPENRVLLHNQYLFALLGLGVPGLGWLLLLLFGPLALREVRRDFCAVVFLTGIAAIMVVDTPFSLKGGLNVVLCFYALLLVGPRQQTLLRAMTTKPASPRSGTRGANATIACQSTPRAGIWPA